MIVKALRLLLLASAGLMTLPACNKNCVNGSGKQATQQRTVETFSKVKAGGALRLILTQDSSQKLTITADDNILPLIKTQVKGDELTIEMDGNFCRTGPITVMANAKSLSGVDVSGAVEVTGTNKITTGDFSLDLSGNSKVDLNIDAANFKTNASGASRIKLQGQARSHEIDMSGSGEVDALDFVVGDYRIETSGASKCQINVLNNLTVHSSGASEIAYRGSPKEINNSHSGSGTIRKIE